MYILAAHYCTVQHRPTGGHTYGIELVAKALVLSALEVFSSFGTNSEVGHSAFFAGASEPLGQLGIAPQHVLGGVRQALFNSSDQILTGGVQL